MSMQRRTFNKFFYLFGFLNTIKRRKVAKKNFEVELSEQRLFFRNFWQIFSA